MVRAKFKCEVVNDDTNGTEGKSIVLTAVTNGSKENDDFFKWTPAGIVNLSIECLASQAAITQTRC